MISQETNPEQMINEDVLTPTTRIQSLGRSLIESFMTPVEVRRTQEQIEAATRRAKYGDISRPMNTTCPISLEPFVDEDDVVIIQHCGYIFKLGLVQTADARRVGMIFAVNCGIIIFSWNCRTSNKTQ